MCTIAAAAVVDQSAGLERGSHPPSVLPTPVGHRGYVGAQLQASIVSLRWTISKPRGCCCCSVRKPRPISFSCLSTLIRRSSTQRDTTIAVGSVCVGSCGCPLKWASQQIVSLPFSVGGLGLHSALLVRHAAYWSSWADCVHMVNRRHPQICRSILRSIVRENPPHHIEGVTISEAALPWEELAEGLRPGRRAIEDEDRTQPRFGWQKLAAGSLQLDFRENVWRRERC